MQPHDAVAPLKLGKSAYALCWVCILAVHAAAGAFFAAVAVFYWRLESSYLGYFLEFYGIGLPSQHYTTVAIALAGSATPHCASVLAMVCGSLVQRRLAFGFRREGGRSDRRHRASKRARYTGMLTGSYAGRLAAGLARSFELVLGPTGLFGVRGRHYGAILVCRELLETALQTVQAYKMSQLLPRATLNNMYVGLIVANCWSAAAVRVAFADRSALEWLLSLLLDCVLDLVTSAGITLMIARYYLADYDWVIGGFWNALWTNDTWFARAKNEFQLAFVTSWGDLATRVLFSVGAAISLADMKALLQPSARSNRVGSAASERARRSAFGATAVAPAASAIAPVPRNTPASKQPTTAGPRVKDIWPRRSLCGRCWTLPALFGAWGLVLLLLHLHAGSIPAIEQCRLQVRPWTAVIPYCYVVAFDCQRLSMAGTAAEIESMWEQFGRATVERIVIRHCPALELPPMLREFAALNTIKVYNSSITAWSNDAAISATDHPQIALVYLVRVELPDGRLPAGLLSPDTPQTLVEITICVSNLRQLPDDLDTKWPPGLVLNIELGELAAVPACLLRLLPKILSVYGNPIETLPSALFQLEGMVGLDVGATKVASLPETVNSIASTLEYVIVANTGVSAFWKWIDAMIHRYDSTGYPLIFAFGTPYCDAFERIANGSQADFPPEAPVLRSSLSLLMDANHWQTITKVASCARFFSEPFFGLAGEDALAAAGN